MSGVDDEVLKEVFLCAIKNINFRSPYRLIMQELLTKIELLNRIRRGGVVGVECSPLE